MVVRRGVTLAKVVPDQPGTVPPLLVWLPGLGAQSGNFANGARPTPGATMGGNPQPSRHPATPPYRVVRPLAYRLRLLRMTEPWRTDRVPALPSFMVAY